ncbi:MAG: hypothetical protein ABEJ95_02045 [Candidatus Nanohalobium sp.]
MNRTSDGRFKEDRAVFESADIGSVIEDVKNDKGWTWRYFAQRFDISTYTARQGWRNEADSIPLFAAEKLQEMSEMDLSIQTLSLWHGQRKGGSKSKRRGKTPDNWNVELAELYGALLGDGCLYSNMNGFCITGNAELDEEYIRYLGKLCVSIFNIEPKIYFQSEENVVRLILNSRKVAAYLKNQGFPKGEKAGKEIQVPETLHEKKFLKPAIRGLFDTDGGVYSHPNSGIMMDITAKNESLINFLEKPLTL